MEQIVKHCMADRLHMHINGYKIEMSSDVNVRILLICILAHGLWMCLIELYGRPNQHTWKEFKIQMIMFALI